MARLVQRAPPSAAPYLELLRLDRPIGTYLLFWPCGWSLAIASPFGSLPDPYLLFLFGVGSLLMRGAGCIINDLWDRDLDKMVDRTKERPLASGRLSIKQAVYLLLSQLGLSLLVLTQFSNWFSVFLAFGVVPIVFSYPAVKRFSHWPQFVLGLAFNWGALLGYAAVHGTLDLSIVLPLYLAGISWTLVYDTIYAHQDLKYDLQVGIKSTAIRFLGHTKTILSGFSALTIASLATSGHFAGLGWPYYVGLAAATAHLTWQISGLNVDDERDCGRKFRSNKWFGAIVFISIVLSKIIPII